MTASVSGDLHDAPRFRLAIGADRLGVALKTHISEYLVARGHTVEDFGCASDEDIDYPDIAAPVARAVAAGIVDRAILICGTGLGMAIAANKIRGVRAVSVSDAYSAERASKSNDAQVLCLGALVVGRGLAITLVDRWLESEFAGGQSARKVSKIDVLDERLANGIVQ
jgi:ribose 5-phosphate isomerase B